MARRGKPTPDLHISVAELRKLRPAELLAIEGPKFIMREVVRGHETLAVLISHDKWRTLNHNVPEVDPHNAKVFHVGEQAYLTIPVYRDAYKCWRPLVETGLDIVARPLSRKRITV